MHLSHLNFRRWYLLLVCLCFFLPTTTSAETKTLTAEGTYTMGDGETPLVAEMRALQQAKRQAVEQAGTYIQSYTKAKHYELTADEIETVSAGLIEVEVLDKRRQVVGEGIQFYVKIKALVTVEKADELVSRLRQKSSDESLNLVRDYKKLKDDYARLATEMDTLKRQMAEAKSEQEKQRTASLITQQERRYLARAALEKCYNSYPLANPDNTADDIACMDEVIRLDPSFADAWASRASEKKWRNDYEGSIADYTEAIRLDPKPERYRDRGVAFAMWKKPDRAIRDYTEAIRLNPQDGEAYRLRAIVNYYETGNYSEALNDYTNAIRLNSVTHKDDWDPLSTKRWLIRLCVERALTYMQLGQSQKAIEDFTTGLQLLDSSDEHLYGTLRLLESQKASSLRRRAKAYKLLNQDIEAMLDYRQACGLEDGLPGIPAEAQEVCDSLKSR